MRVKQFVKRIIYRERASSEDLIRYYRRKGVQIGAYCTFHAPRTIKIDTTQPFLITIGNHVEITDQVSILCHDFAWSTFKAEKGDIVGSNAPVHIGNNVFIGEKSIILKGVTIGDNVIIGAGSIVSHDIPNNSVAAGNPAKIIMTYEEFYEKRKKEYVSEAKILAKEYVKSTGKIPPKDIFRDFFPLFYVYHENDRIPCSWQKIIHWGGKNREKTIKYLMEHEPVYAGYDDFISDALGDEIHII